MKILVQFLLFNLITFNVFSQTEFQIIGTWDGGVAFDNEYKDSLLLFQFNESSFHFQYGPNHFEEYQSYQMINDTLILLKNNGYQEATFRIEELTDSTLIIQALNWSGVYLSNVLCSPWLDAEEPKVPIDEDFDSENILNNDVLRTKLEFKKIN